VKGGSRRGPRLLGVDLDGTLLDREGRPHERDVRAIRAAMAHGVRVSIVTGRLYSGTRDVAQLLGLRGPVACADGSHVVQVDTHATLLHLGVSGREAVILREILGRAGLTLFVFAKDAIGHDGAGTPFLSYVTTWSNDVRLVADVLEHEFWTAEDGVTAVVGLGKQEQVAETVRDIARDLPGKTMAAMFPVRRLPHLDQWAVIVRSSGGTKGTAVRWIAERERIDLADTVCVGDWVNDVPMFEVVGRSFAMGQAPAEVKSRATDVLLETTEEGGGVARAVAEAFGILAD
jgi:hydroxymethylpyrimidine pyrophosphatase-like HAD family hydrolase